MRLTLKFVLPLGLVLGLIAYLVTPLVDSLMTKWFVRDIDIRARLIANTIHDPLVDLLHSGPRAKILPLFNRLAEDERLFAVAFCEEGRGIRIKTQLFPSEVHCRQMVPPASTEPFSSVVALPEGPLHISFQPIRDAGGLLGQLILVHDLSFAQRRTADTRKYIFAFFAGLAAIISLITVLVAQLSWKGWVAGLRDLLTGEGLYLPGIPVKASPELRPILGDLRSLVRNLGGGHKDEGQISWSPESLKQILRRSLAGNEIMVVSNREPYIHVREDGETKVQLPASGLVTALEPVMRACSGTWLAHGSGSADRETVDKRDHVAVPPGNPCYQIRRLWLSAEEEAGYYYGFSNEGLWPLCHIAHVRPVFRSSDWKEYVAVNRKFARAVVEEAKTEDPVILIQDYHFALLPKLIRQSLPEATIITFWHIPWPNAEAFGICPWRGEILDGLLGSSILGFHTRFHCNNFIDTVDRYMESRIDRETSTISYGGSLTAVNDYPIALEYPVRWLDGQRPVEDCRRHARLALKLPEDRLLGLGVDRLDYTKGILERFAAVERLLETNPGFAGKFTFLQIAAPSRSRIAHYREFEIQVAAAAEKINGRFGSPGYQPILLKIEHYEPDAVFELFRAADLCFVSSLHDGMNLVAKEFVAAREDEGGVLILSQFTGASREMPEALIVNPYNTDQCAAALRAALEMPRGEQASRMRAMRNAVREYNVYRWAGRMLMDASKLRQRARFTGSRELREAAALRRRSA